jgi:transposase InsO family protein
VLAYRVSISMDTDCCMDAVKEAITRYGTPGIFNTNQGSQFTSAAFTGLLMRHGIRISMDGKGCWRDNVFIERLWRFIKYEEVCLHAHIGSATNNVRMLEGRFACHTVHPNISAQPRERFHLRGLPTVARGRMRVSAVVHELSLNDRFRD